MSPDQVDQAILAFCKPQFLKVARVIIDVANSSQGAITYGANIHRRPKALEKPMGTDVDFIADWIKALSKPKSWNRRGISIGGDTAKFV